ncbi:uncharacterized protein [Drosophila kikkawai]|uniref:Reverse transcriptase domain-containing protein n=1 Tax=Drosophila kikkawai TaxID=30033 RepID=A0ABM4GQ70_DROKI
MSQTKPPAGRDDETQALAVARAEEELLRNFQRNKQEMQHSPPASMPEKQPVSAPPNVQGPVFVFGETEEETATPKRSFDAVSPDGNQSGAHKKQRVDTSAPALAEKLGKMLDEMIAKLTDTKTNNKKVARHVTQGTIDSMMAMKKLQVDISAALADGHTKGSTSSVSQQTTPTLTATILKAACTTGPGNSAWQQVRAKPKPRNSQPRPESSEPKGTRAPNAVMPRKQRADAILIKCSEGSYADMLKLVKTEPSLQGLKDNVQGLRRTANGGLLLRMQKPQDPSTQQLQAALRTAISDKAEVAVMQETVQVEIRDLDEMTSGEEVTMALFAGEDSDIASNAAPRMRKAFGGTQTATVNLRPDHARRLLDKGKIRIGWVVCRIRQKTELRRCLKCMGYGHTSTRCRASDSVAKATQNSCFRCGEEGHKPREIARDARGRSPVLIAGDFNAWSTAWGSSKTTQRGTILLDALATLDVCLLNDGARCTYSKAGRESIIDLTFASPELCRTSHWKVTDLLTYSDHAAIITQTTHSQQGPSLRQSAYKVHTLNADTLLSSMDGNVITGDANTCADILAARIKAASLFEICYKEKKKALKIAIKTSKSRCFQELCDAADQEPFGSAYKLVMGKLYRPPTPTSQEQLGAIISTLFPSQPPLVLPNIAASEAIFTSEEELLCAVASSKAAKAPGPDGIPNAALHAIMKSYPSLFSQVYNRCIAERTFPRAWKQQRLVLIPKRGKMNDDSSSYRPLCMLNTLGNIFERIICNKLEREIEERGALESAARFQEEAEHDRRDTRDVKNAFNSANWSLVLQALQHGGISGNLTLLIADYFKDRVLLYTSDDGNQMHHVTGGVPQGSVLGPILWNVMYDGILRLLLPDGCAVVGFADDIALVTVEKHLSDVSAKCSLAIDMMMSWLKDNGLTLAEHKTEAVLISSRKTVEKVTFRVGSTYVESSPAIKYLGVMIDHRLNFKSHLEYAAAKASKATAAISRMMANTRGPKQHSRRLIATVVTSTILYAAPIWAEAMRTVSYSRQCKSAYRRCALRISSCFCTVSEEAALVVSGAIPIDLLAEDRRTGNSYSRIQRSSTMARWQDKWNNASTGRWTYRLIPDLVPWLQRRHGQLDYYTTQIITGHGCFKAYLHRFKHEGDPYCDYCGSAFTEDAEHAFFVCPLFSAERAALEAAMNCRLTPDNLVCCMMETPSKWDAVAEMAASVMRELRRREQTRRTEGR